jgi:hypothetical protein
VRELARKIPAGGTRRCTTLLAAGACIIAAGALAEDLNVQGEVSSFFARDRDGDSLAEIFVSYHEGSQRFLGIFRGQRAYSSLPDTVIPVDPQAVLFTLGDFDAAPGLDVVLVSRSSAVIYPLGAAGAAAAPRKIADVDLFFTVPSRSSFPAWLSRFPMDLDKNGAEELALPEKRSLRILWDVSPRHGEKDPGAKESSPSSGGQTPRASKLPISFYLLTDARSEKLEKALEDFAEADKSPTALLDATAALPFPLFRDFDGDGRTDVIVKQPGQRLEVFLQRSGDFPTAPDLQVPIPWAKEATSLELIDLNGDRRLDIVASQLLLKDLASEVKIFIQDPSRPQSGFAEAVQVLRIQGFFRAPSFADADQDGRTDLLVTMYRVDLLESIKKDTVDEVELTHEIFRGTAETPFERRPSFRQAFTVRTRDLEAKGSRSSLVAGHDMTGDGRPDILFLDGGRGLRLHRAIAGSALRYEEIRAFTERVDDPESVETANLDGKPGDEVILRYKRSLQVHRSGGSP